MNWQNNKEFKAYYKKYSEVQLKKFLDEAYNALSKKFNSNIEFGFNGCKEFLGSILLLKYDKNVEKNIAYGLCMVFDGKCDAMDFSDYMEGVIGISRISLDEWIDLYDYLEREHKWIENHKCV